MMALATSAFAQNFHFSAVCESGQTLYYRILSEENQEVSVTFPNNNPAGWYGYDEPEGNLVIPEFVEHEGIIYTVASLDHHAFMSCHEITSVVFPNTIRRIGAWAFDYCIGLSSEIIIPDHCTFIGCGAFICCSAITSLTIGASVDTIQWDSFTNCTGLESIFCKAPAPPFCQHITDDNYNEHWVFDNVPTDIPVQVNCLTIEQFQMSQEWSRFTNMESMFLGAPSLTVGVNDPEYGSAEVISIPEDCNELTATVKATPYPGHTFGYWKRGHAVVSFEPEYTFTLNHNTSLIACFDGIAIIDDSIAYPDHIIGRVFNDSGLVSHEYLSDFIYNQSGQMRRFLFNYDYYSNISFYQYPLLVSYIYSCDESAHPEQYETHSYQYNNLDQISHSSDFYYSYDETRIYNDYTYDDNHRLVRRDKTRWEEGVPYNNYIYTFGYENNYKTRFETCYFGYISSTTRTSRTINHYDEQQKILTSQIIQYNFDGDTISNTLKNYSYTPNNKTNNIVTQSFNEGEWINTSIDQYIYDYNNRVIEHQTGSWLAEEEDWNITKKIIYDFNDDEQKLTVSFKKKVNNEWVWDLFSGQTIFFEPELKNWQNALAPYNLCHVNQFDIEFHYVIREIEFPKLSEWYYEIVWDNGSTTYQHLEYTADTTIGTSRPKIIVRSNTHYDKDAHAEITHEYILEENGKVYWWNKTLQEFTTLYDYNAETGDEWEIKVDMESLTVHVDSVGVFEYEGITRKVLHISDIHNIFNGDIVVGYGHMTSFFPEKLMNQGKGYDVEGLRCYWVGDALLYHNGDEDCDAIYSDIHGVEEDVPSTNPRTFTVYPNPANDILFIEAQNTTSLQRSTEYRITNLMGQTLLQGNLTAETQQIDISNLPKGMYFISVGDQTRKFVK